MPTTTYTCLICWQSFAPTQTTQRYCSKACRNRRAKPTITVECTWCGLRFAKAQYEVARYPKHFCSRACATREHHRQRRLPVGPVPRTMTVGISCAITLRPGQRLWTAHACHECGAAFLAGTRYPHKYCSKRCARKNRRRLDKRKRRAWTRTTNVGTVDLATIAQRDGWRCHICHRKVSRANWSLDHLIPLSYGGPHTNENTALAHHRCNTLRSNTGAAQLRLMG